MSSSKLLELVLSIADDMKANDITSIDVRHLTDVTDTIVVCSGTSNRHTRSISEQLISTIKAQGFKPLGVEGQEEGEWVLVDLGDVVVHVMLPQVREFYSLEKLWGATERQRQARAHEQH